LGYIGKLAGLGLIICGAIVQVQFDMFTAFLGNTFSGAAILLVIVGVVIFVIGFFGCCGAYKENYCMTMTFAVLLGIIFILEIAAGITAYTMRGNVKGFVKEALVKSMGDYGNDTKAGITKSWDVAQIDFECCGVHNYTEWEEKFGTNEVPDSCCRPEFQDNEGCGKNIDKATANDKIYADKGCLNEFEQWVEDNIYMVGGVGIGLAFVQVVGIILACCLARTIKKEYSIV